MFNLQNFSGLRPKASWESAKIPPLTRMWWEKADFYNEYLTMKVNQLEEWWCSIAVEWVHGCRWNKLKQLYNPSYAITQIQREEHNNQVDAMLKIEAANSINKKKQ